MKLDREVILETALGLLDEVGMDKLSTRLLAERLGVQQPALYWHFRNKRALLDAMNSELLRRAHKRQLPLPTNRGKPSCARTRAASGARCWRGATARGCTRAPSPIRATWKWWRPSWRPWSTAACRQRRP